MPLKFNRFQKQNLYKFKNEYLTGIDNNLLCRAASCAKGNGDCAGDEGALLEVFDNL